MKGNAPFLPRQFDPPFASGVLAHQHGVFVILRLKTC